MPLKKEEEVKEEGFAPTFSDENKPEKRIYWSRAVGLSIANFVKEVREGNAIVTPEASLNFTNHLKMTEDPEEIKFIESSQSFRDGKVKRVESLEEAHVLTAQVTSTRIIREITSTSDVTHATVGRR